MTGGYEPRWDIDLRRGERGETLTRTLLDDITNGRAEVKTDDKALETGRIYIEHACLWSDGLWHESGIVTTQAEFWVVVIGRLVLAAPTEVVRVLHQEAIVARRFVECSRGSHPTKGVYVPIQAYVSRIISLR